MNRLKIIHRLLVVIFIWGFSAISYLVFSTNIFPEKSLEKIIQSQLYQNNISDSTSIALDSIEKKLYGFVNKISIINDNKHYSVNELDELLENAFNKLVLNGIPKHRFSNENFSLWYNETNFKAIIDRIDRMEVNITSYKSQEANTIKSLIDVIKQKDKKIYTYLYFEDHFWELLTDKNKFDNVYDHAYQILNNTGYELDSIQRYREEMLDKRFDMAIDSTFHFKMDRKLVLYKETYIPIHSWNIMGDFAQSHNELGVAIYGYFNSMKKAREIGEEIELAKINHKIANLYSKYSPTIYNTNDQLHYASAAESYKKANDTINFNLLKIMEINSLCLLRSNFMRKATLKELDKIKNILYDGLIRFQKRNSIINTDFYLFNSLALYCNGLGSSKDSIIATRYQKLATIAIMNHTDQLDLDNILSSLDFLANYLNLQANHENAMHYIDMALGLIDIQNDKSRKNYFAYKKAKTYLVLGKIKYALKLVKEDTPEGSDELKNAQNYLAACQFYDNISNKTKLWSDRIYYKTLSRGYLAEFYKECNYANNVLGQLRDFESTNKYDLFKNEFEILSDDYSTLNSEFDKKQVALNSMENQLYGLKKEYDEMSYKLVEKDVELTRKKREATKKREELNIMNDNYGKKEDLLKNLNFKIIQDSLKAKNDFIQTQIQLEEAINNSINAKNAAKSAWIFFGLAILASIIIGFYTRRMSKKEKLRSDKYTNEKEKGVRELEDKLSEINIILFTKNEEIKIKNNEILKSNTRAAISQLYARTDSHDLGHVLDAYKSIADFASDERNGQYFPLGDISQELKTKFACHEISVDIDYSEKEILTPKFSILPNLMGYFNQYLKTRMDFRADVATSDPNSLTTLDFYQDVFSPFNNNLIFNNRISGISDKELKYQFKIFKGKTQIEESDKLLVAIPNDVLGCQAMYIIWSNVIRNTVKHSELTKLEKNLEITIIINDYEPCPDYVEIIIYTNVYRSKSFVDDLVNKRNVSFDGKIWVQDKDDRQGRLRDNSLGTIEMATCAAYLQKLAVIEVDNPKFKLFENGIFQEGKPKVVDDKLTPMIMYAFAQPRTDGKVLEEKLFSLGYKFHLLRPKEVLVICYQPEVFGNQFISNFDRASLTKHGIEFVKPDKIIGNSFDHKFLAFAGNQSDFDSFKVNNSKMAGTLPKRQVLINQTTNFKNINEFVKECWNLWMDHYNKSFNVFSCHYDEKVHVFPEILIENPDLNINLYNHHKSLACETDNKTITKLRDGNYHEMMCGHHWTTKNLLEFLMKKRFLKSPYAQPYLESVFTNIIVIDERIQKSIVVHTKKYADKIPFDIYFNQLGVFIPSQKDGDPDLNRTNLMEEKEKIKNFIQKHINKSDFVVIHLGILEKLLVDKSNKNDISIDVVINELIFNKENRKKVVITSGRGKANNVNPDISFVPISLIQNAIETTFDKFRLVQILYNSRKSI